MSRKSRKKLNKLADLPNDSLICADANILAYHFNKTPEYTEISAKFLERSANGEITILTSPQIVSNVVHRSMLAEAQRDFGLDNKNLANHLKTHPEIVRQLKEHLDVPSSLARFRVHMLPLNHIHHHAAKFFRSEYGIMANDSLLLGFMRVEKVRHLATNDRDFRQVKGIMVWEP
ncbi:MAG: type II toxin-antitoxin system VapC family toxin [Chloroflexota bacterium]